MLRSVRHSQATPAVILAPAKMALGAALRPYVWRKNCNVASGSDISEEAVLEVLPDEQDSSEQVELLIPSALWSTAPLRCSSCL